MDKTAGGSVGRQPRRQLSTRKATEPHGLSATQASMGNAAVVQMLRNAGHPWAQEEHRHSSGCGHRTAGPTGSLGTPTVQRRIRVQDSNSAHRRTLTSFEEVMNFLNERSVSVYTVYADMYRLRTPSAALAFSLESAIRSMLNDHANRVYADSRDDAYELAADICAEIGPPRSASNSHPSRTSSTMSHLPHSHTASARFQRPSTAGRSAEYSTESGGAEGIGSLAQMGADALAHYTPHNPVQDGLIAGARGAVSNRIDAVTSAPRPGGAVGAVRLGLYAATGGLERADAIMERVAHESPNGGQELLTNWGEFRTRMEERAAAQAGGSLATGAALGRIASTIPHPGARMIGTGISAVTGVLGTANHLSDMDEQFRRLQHLHPAAYDAVVEDINRNNAQIGDRLSNSTWNNHWERQDPFGG